MEKVRPEIYKIILSVIFCYTLISCNLNKKDAEGFTIYTIEKGNHASNVSLPVSINKTSFKFKVKFDSSAIYQTADTANQADINKLYGFIEDSLGNPHVNSARVGWRWYKNQLQLLAYVYNNSVIENETIIQAVELNKETTCEINLLNSMYEFRVDTSNVYVRRYSKSATFAGNKLYPYFGGDEVAPHKILIYIKDI